MHGPNLCIIMSTVVSKQLTESIIWLEQSSNLIDLNKLYNVSWAILKKIVVFNLIKILYKQIYFINKHIIPYLAGLIS